MVNEAILFLYLLAAVLGVSASAVLILRQGQKYKSTISKIPGGIVSEKILIVILLVLTVQSLKTFLFSKNLFYGSSFYLGLGVFGDLIIWPLFYLYFKFIGSGIRKIKKVHLLHFLVPVLVFVPMMRLAAVIRKDPFLFNFLKFKELRDGKVPGTGPGFRGPMDRPPWEKQGGPPPPDSMALLNRAVLIQIDMLLFLQNGEPPVLNRFVHEITPGRVPWGMRKNDFKRPGVEQMTLMGGGIRIYVWIYIILIVISIIGYSKKMRGRSNSVEKHNLMWLTVLITVIAMAQAMMTFLFIFGSSFDRPFIIFMFGNTLPMPLLYILAIWGYLIFTGKGPVEEKKYGKNGLSRTELEQYFHLLIAYMKKHRPYRDESLTLKQLAEALDIHANHLSQVINKKEGCNFRDFINSFRVEEVKKELLKPGSKDKNILSIAYDAGFNSKSAFNLVFKKHTCMTPSEYAKKYGMQSLLPAGVLSIHNNPGQKKIKKNVQSFMPGRSGG